MALHVVKLCVGAETPEDLAGWQDAHRVPHDGRDCPFHDTRMFPRRTGEVLDGGSLYWVIKGVIRVRQQILALLPMDEGDGQAFCRIILSPSRVLTEAAPRRPFQGWRYLPAEDAPADLSGAGHVTGASPELVGKLKAALVW